MLLIDGVRYEEWKPASEDEFERIVREHAKDIFGEQSIYLEKHKLRTTSGIGSIPDGYVIILGGEPQWHIVEVELSSHPLYDHIVPQISKFINGIKNPSTQKDIVSALYQEIDSDDFLKLRLKKAIGTTETYKFLADLVSKPPVITIIIEKRTEQLNDAISALAHSQIKPFEFQTFIRDGVGLSVHAHLFEPLYKPAIPIKSELLPTQTPLGSNVVIVLQADNIKRHYIRIPAASKGMFPQSKTPLALETGADVIQTVFHTDSYGSVFGGKDLNKWFRAHPALKPGDKLIIEPSEPMKRYRLKIA